MLERLVKHIITAICLREPCLRCFYGREEHNKGIIGETTVIVLRTNTFFPGETQTLERIVDFEKM